MTNGLSKLFGKRLKECREAIGFTQGKLAKECGLPQSSISHFESGRREPSLNNLYKIHKGIGVPWELLMGCDRLVTDVRCVVIDGREYIRKDKPND